MRQVFTKFLGVKVNRDDLTISAALADQSGQSSEIALAPELLMPLMHNLMGSVGAAEFLAEEGVPPAVAADQPHVKSAIPAMMAFVSQRSKQGKYVLTVGCENGAEYNFSLTEEQRALLLNQP